MEEDLSRIFQAATLSKTLNPDQIDSLDFEELAQSVLNAQDVPLRIEGQLVYGLSHMLNDKAAHLLSDSSMTDKNVIDAFGYRSTATFSDEEESQGLDGVGRGYVPTELGTESLMSAVGVHEHEVRGDATFDYDQSVDAQVRDDLGPDLSMEAAAAPSEDLLNAEEGQNEVRNALGDLSFGPDLDVGVASSSPPPDEGGAVTPEDYGDNESIAIAGSSPVSRQKSPPRKRQKRRQRMAPVDDEISIVIPSEAPAVTLQQDLAKNSVSHRADDEPRNCVRLSDEIENLLDPENVRSLVKKRRLAAMGFSLDAEEEIDQTQTSPGVDDLDITGSPVAAGSPEPEPLSEGSERPSTQDSQMSIDAPTKVSGDSALARGLIEEALVAADGKPVKLGDLAHGRRERADAFSELLVLAARGRVNPQQSHSYGDITIRV